MTRKYLSSLTKVNKDTWRASIVCIDINGFSWYEPLAFFGHTNRNVVYSALRGRGIKIPGFTYKTSDNHRVYCHS